jgi:hemolysin activation/secretion protein
MAQTQPDAGQILQQTRPPNWMAPSNSSQSPISITPTQSETPKASDSSEARVLIDRFDFVGNTSIGSEALRQELSEFAGKQLNFGELMQIVERVEARYKREGYFLAQGSLPPQKIRNGVIEITINEGLLGEVRLEGESRIAPEVVYAYLDHLSKGKPLTLPTLERQILLVNELAGSQATLDLQAGENNGTSDVVLLQKADALAGPKLEFNNYGAASTGEYRAGFSLDLNSPFHQGDHVSFNAMNSDTQGLASYGLRTDWPIGSDGVHLLAALSRAQYSLGAGFASLKASGTADSVHLGSSYPYVRSRIHNVRVQADAEANQLRDEFQSTNTVLDKASQAISLSLDSDWSDESAGTNSRVNAALKIGRLSLGAAALTQDIGASGLNTEGTFNKINLTLQHSKILGGAWSVSALFMAQWSDKNLDSSEKLSLGGPTSLPGYASGEGNADSGFQLKATVHRQMGNQYVLGAYADYADLQINVSPLAGAKNAKHLSDFGISLDWQYERRVNVNAQVAWALDEAQNPTDDKRPHLWVTAALNW